MTGDGPVVLESEALRVTVNPLVGGTITAIEHKGLGASVLGTTPWEPEVTTPDSFAAPDERIWLTRYGGGWPLLFPNGGDACEFDGVFHGFQMTVTGELVTVRERLRMMGTQPVKVMWGHHPTFGSDLLAGPFEIQSGARHVTIDDGYDPPLNPLRPGAVGPWPLVPGKTGPFDLGRPQGRVAALVYLQDFASPWMSVRRLDDSVAAALSWESAVFPYAWLWYELGGNAEPPWEGKTRLIGMEPNTTWPATGLADANRRGGRLMTLQPGTEITTAVRLHVFKPEGSIQDVDAAGQAIFKAS
jgi:hypothetical protein